MNDAIAMRPLSNTFGEPVACQGCGAAAREHPKQVLSADINRFAARPYPAFAAQPRRTAGTRAALLFGTP
ncbi:hypothetical protein [Actinomadura rubrisoli]|uniref:Uncharacterized protein n=1 Tax=Actinomadura rubrisoli TaxID=2530368 RepID=A0A4V2YWW2_9ACTN|nr:hypothetical protein [Actinomadura rubrisoli]TDD86967.1 hypothetical protein E1298_16795 [Actinomadura rubrisoli]